jgi:hypothetical protein
LSVSCVEAVCTTFSFEVSSAIVVMSTVSSDAALSTSDSAPELGEPKVSQGKKRLGHGSGSRSWSWLPESKRVPRICMSTKWTLAGSAAERILPSSWTSFGRGQHRSKIIIVYYTA